MATYGNLDPSAPRPIPQPSQPRRPSYSSTYLAPSAANLPPGTPSGTTPPQHVHFDDARTDVGPPPRRIRRSSRSSSYSSQLPPQAQAPYGTSPHSGIGAYPPQMGYQPPDPSLYPPQNMQYAPVAGGGGGGGGAMYSASPPGAYPPPPPDTRARGWSHGSNGSHSSRRSRQSLPPSRRGSHSPAPPMPNQYIAEGYSMGLVPAQRVPSRSADPYYRSWERPAEYDYDYEGRRRRYSSNHVDRFGRPLYGANGPEYDDYDRDEYYDERRRRRRSDSGIDAPRRHSHHRRGRHEKTTQEIKDEIENRPTMGDSMIAAFDTVRDAFSSKRH